MLQFTPIQPEHWTLLRAYYGACGYGLCEYSAGTKVMWEGTLHPSFAEAAGCLIVRNEIGGQVVFDYPVPGPEGDEDAALSEVEATCMDAGIPPVISVVPEEKASVLLARYPYVHVSNVRTWRDYLYRAEDLREFTGRRYAGQRNHVRKFHTACPEAEFRVLTAAEEPAVQQFWRDYGAEFAKEDNPRAVNELSYAKALVALRDREGLFCGGLFDGEKLIALSLAERCGQTLIIHIEKALYSYEGVYPALVQEFARAFSGGLAHINREDDAADRGLRTSKLQYGPEKLAPKYRFEPQNELLQHVRELPALTTERLTLSPLTEADLPAYNALVLDGARNRWWGYDDVAGLGEAPQEDSFLRVAQRDFENRTAANFAVRLDGQLIGEAVLYRFNYRGDAELGCRIDAAHAGHGYGTEAFAAVADWALYKVHLTRVVAKCFRENQASQKMLSACMRPAGQDDTFLYFERLV